MNNFESITQILKDNNKSIDDFVDFVCDKDKNHYLWRFKGEVMIKLENGIKEKNISIDKRLNRVLKNFLEI